jgi:mRNA-degrading endonuclease toxin of MazEF toxin-antitoxin module
MFVPEGHEPDRAVVVLTRATLPAVALMLVVPVASGVGSELTPFALPAPCTR